MRLHTPLFIFYYFLIIFCPGNLHTPRYGISHGSSSRGASHLGFSTKQLLDEVEQNIVIGQWRADQLFADAEGRG